MTLLELASDLFRAIEKQRWDKVKQHLAPDFKFYGPFPDPANQEQWLQFQEALSVAFPDWSFGVNELKEQGQEVKALLHITGTHKGKLDLPIAGMPRIPATGMKLDMPGEEARLVFKDAFLAELRVLPKSGGGGLGALLVNLGFL